MKGEDCPEVHGLGSSVGPPVGNRHRYRCPVTGNGGNGRRTSMTALVIAVILLMMFIFFCAPIVAQVAD